MNKLFLKGVKHGLPIGLGYLSVSFAFGMQCVGGGLTVLQALLISMTNLTSAGQLAGLQVMLAGSSLIEMAMTQFIINLRYALMGLSLSQKLGPTMTTPRRMFFSFANTDEIFAVASAQPEKLHHHYLYGLMLMPYIGWSLGTLLGAAAGAVLPEFVCNALGIAIYGMFLAIILPPRPQGNAGAHRGAPRHRREPHVQLPAGAEPGVRRLRGHHLRGGGGSAGRSALPHQG